MDCRSDGLQVINADDEVSRVPCLHICAFYELKTAPIYLGCPRPAIDKTRFLILSQRSQELQVMGPSHVVGADEQKAGVCCFNCLVEVESRLFDHVVSEGILLIEYSTRSIH